MLVSLRHWQNELIFNIKRFHLISFSQKLNEKERLLGTLIFSLYLTYKYKHIFKRVYYNILCMRDARIRNPHSH